MRGIAQPGGWFNAAPLCTPGSLALNFFPQPNGLQHYMYFAQVDILSDQPAIGNMRTGLPNNIGVYVGEGTNLTDQRYEAGAVTATSLPFEPTYRISQPASCQPLDLSCPLYPAGATPLSNDTYLGTTRLWYRTPAANREPSVTDTYFFATGGFGISTSMPFYSNQTRLQAALNDQVQPWHSAVFAPSPAPASWQLESVTAVNIHLDEMSQILRQVTNEPQVPDGSVVIYVVETATGFMVASSIAGAGDLIALPAGCTVACINDCCRVSAINSNDPVIATSAVRGPGG